MRTELHTVRFVIAFAIASTVAPVTDGVESVRVVDRGFLRHPIVRSRDRVIDELLAEFQTQQRQMAAVIDEWGAFEGVVTVEDVVEVIVGDIRDQFDPEEPVSSIERIDDGGYAIDGDVPLTAVNEQLQTTFETGDIETIGGLVLSHLGRKPETGDTVETDTYQFRIDGVDGARITEVVANRRSS